LHGGDSLDTHTFVQLASREFYGLVADMKTLQPDSNNAGHWANPFALAARELGAFVKAVSDSFGPEQARLAADEWLEELESRSELSVSTPAAWRSITIAAAARAAVSLKAHLTDTKVSAIPSSNC
jgi:hypothetical protein